MIKYRPTTLLPLLFPYLLLGVIPSQGTIGNSYYGYWNQLSQNTITYTNNNYDDDDERFRKAVASLNENFPSEAQKKRMAEITNFDENVPPAIINIIDLYSEEISHLDFTKAKNLNGFNDIDSKLAKKISTISFRSIHYKDIILAENLENVTRLNVKGMISLREIAKKKWEKLTALNLDLSEIENIENIKNYVRSLLKLDLDLLIKEIELPESFEDNCPNEFTKLKNQGWKLNPEKNGQKIISLIKGLKNRTVDEKAIIKRTIEQLIEKGANVNAKDRNGNCSLHMAAFNGCMDIVILLIEKGADVNEKNDGGDRPLHKAIHGGYLNIATRLIEEGAYVNTEGKGGSPLHILSEKDGLAFAKFLIKEGANIDIQDTRGDTPLLHAIYFGYTELAKSFIEKGADVDKTDFYGNSPLLKAIWSNNLSMVILLLENGAKINAQNHSGYSSLHILSGNIVGYPSDEDRQVFAEFLIKEGADIEIKDRKGRTPLLYAAEKTRGGLVDFFIKKGAEINERSYDGYTPLHLLSSNVVGYPADKERIAITKSLIKEGADIEIKDKYGETPLCKAVERGKVGLVKLFIREGANINTENNDGYTPLQIARQRKNSAMINLFITNNRTTSSGWRYRRIIYFLLFRGVF